MTPDFLNHHKHVFHIIFFLLTSMLLFAIFNAITKIHVLLTRFKDTYFDTTHHSLWMISNTLSLVRGVAIPPLYLWLWPRFRGTARALFGRVDLVPRYEAMALEERVASR